MKISMNDPVTVTLTEAGAKIYNEQYAGTAVPWKYRPKHVYAGEEITEPLWGLMHTFGKCIHIGMPEVPFLNNVMDVNNAESIGYYKTKMEAAQKELVNTRAELATVKVLYNGQMQTYYDIANNLGAKLPFDLVNEVARRRMGEIADLQRQLADAIRERDQYKAACEMADALRPLGAVQVVEGGAMVLLDTSGRK